MKYLFFVQGEGRGHLSQALALKKKLEEHGHQILGVIVGVNYHAHLPNFFKKEINVPLFELASPGFTVDKKGKGINIFSTVLKTTWHFFLYLQSLREIKKITNSLNPDILINFYEVLAGNYYRFYHDQRPLFSIGHQYFIQAPAFKFPPKQYLARLAFRFYNHLNAPRGSIKIALSFTSEKDQLKRKLFICPPLIRQDIKNKIPANKNFILVYLLNSGYSESIKKWSQAHPQTKIEAFWDKLTPEKTTFGPNLTFNCLSGEKFITYLANCQAYASTAGFDSIAEAAYLQKTILMIPTKNHFEQKCNAQDAQRAKIAQSSENFNLSLITNEVTINNSQALISFKNWVDNNDDKIVKILEKKDLFK